MYFRQVLCSHGTSLFNNIILTEEQTIAGSAAHASVSFAILFFDVTISSNLCGSKTVIHLVQQKCKNASFSRTKSSVEQKKIFLLNFSEVAFFTSKKLVTTKKSLQF